MRIGEQIKNYRVRTKKHRRDEKINGKREIHIPISHYFQLWHDY